MFRFFHNHHAWSSLLFDCCQKATKGHYLISHPHIKCHRAKHAMDTALFVQNTNVHIVLPVFFVSKYKQTVG